MKRLLNILPVKLLIEWPVIAGLYVLSGQLTPHVSISQSGGTPLWPPSAIALAVGLVVGYRAAIGVWLGALVVNYQLLSGSAAQTPAAAAVLAAGVTAQMLVATLLIQKFVPNLYVHATRRQLGQSTGVDILCFIGLTALTSVVSPSTVVATLHYAGFVSWKEMVPMWITWWVRDYAGILTLTPLLIVIVLSWHQRNVLEPIVFPLTTVWLGLALVVSYIVWQNKTIAAIDRLRQDSREIARQFNRSVERAAEQMQAVEGFLVASDNVGRDDFRRFVIRLGEDDRTRLIFHWVPRVRLSERKKFEARARQDGATEYEVFEWSALGQRFTAENRPEYFPILFAEPHAEDRAEWGLDLGSIPDLLPILNSARDSGRLTGALSNAWPPKRNQQPGLFLYNPVYQNQSVNESIAARREHLLGFIRLELPVTEMLKDALAGGMLQDREVYVFDVTDDDGPLFLTSSVSMVARENEALLGPSAQKLAQLQSSANQASQVELGGRQLLFLVRPDSGRPWIEGLWDVLGIMLIGGLITAALIVYLGMRDRALAQMQQAEKHYRELFEAAPAMYVITHDEKGAPIVTDCNELFLTTLKYERKDVIGHSLAAFHSPESRLRLLSVNGYRGAMEGRTVSGGRELLTSDGRMLPVLVRGYPLADVEGKIVGTRAMYVDISEQKAAEEQMRLVVESAPNGMLMVDQSGMITLVNTQVEQLFGYRRRDLLGKPVEFLMPHRFRDFHQQRRKEFFANPAPRTLGRAQPLFALRADGSEFPAEIGLNPIRSSRGLQVLASVVDITERKGVEEEIRALNVSLEQRVADRTEEIRALNAGLEQRVAERTRELEEENGQRRMVERELQRAHDELQRSVLELERRNQEMRLVGEMVELLESCRSLEEAYEIISRRLPLLLHNTAGALYVITASRNFLECVGHWGESTSDFDQTVEPDDCWALRRNKPHGVESESSDLVCKHVEGGVASAGGYLCLPMVAHGEIMGLVHLRHAKETEGGRSIVANSAKAVTEQLSLILANLRLRETLKNQSIRDPQTSLFNRRYMEDSLDRELSRAARLTKPLVVAMLDLDHFKNLNDRFGHTAGDAVLREWSNVLRSKFRGSDIVCRYGGEEFVIILPEISIESAHERLDELRTELERMVVRHDGQSIHSVTVSIGIAQYPVHGRTNQSLLHAADRALYRAKELGRNRAVIASDEPQDEGSLEWSLRPS